MQVAKYYSNSDIRLEEIDEPNISSQEALLRVEASGICGSDIMEWYREDKVPLVLGHETAGAIYKIGSDVKDFKVGDRVVATHHVPCEECEYCRSGHETVCETLRTTNFYPGGFSQLVRLPAINLKKGTFKIPAHVSFESATFVEPLGCVIRGQRLAQMQKGKRVLIIGSGMAGMLHIKLAKWLQAKTIIATDIDPYRLRRAMEFGADLSIYADEDVPLKVKGFNDGRLADLVILCAGAQSAIAQGLKSVERGGTVLFFTAAPKDSLLPVSTNEIFWRTEVSLLSSYAADPKDLKQALKLISEKEILVEDLITHRFPLKDIQRGFDCVVRPQNSIKVIIEPQR